MDASPQHPYLFATEDDLRHMLAAIGVQSLDELFDSIPAPLRLRRPLDLPPALSELELTQVVGGLAGRNEHVGKLACFLGGGAYDHFVPAVVDAIASRAEFYTSYTPYQPEVSQGNLQVMFEYQSLICELTGMEVSNASLYDGGSAAVEAALLCLSASKRPGKVVTSASVHPEYRRILETYLAGIGGELVTVGAPDGVTDLAELERAVDDRTGCVLLQHPNFFGCLEPVEQVVEIAHRAGALVAQAFDPISLGLLRRPGDLGADVAIAEGQSLGTPLLYGGPYLGVMACREAFVRRLPGRIAGQATDKQGRRCWVLALQTREQHIQRERATSNICTNQGLFALRAAVYLALQGPQGLRETAELCLRKARYAQEQLTGERHSGRDGGARWQPAFAAPTFKEFVVRDTTGQVEESLRRGREAGLLAGLPLGRWYPELADCLLVAVTEKRTRPEIERLAACLRGTKEVCHA